MFLYHLGVLTEAETGGDPLKYQAPDPRLLPLIKELDDIEQAPELEREAAEQTLCDEIESVLRQVRRVREITRKQLGHSQE